MRHYVQIARSAASIPLACFLAAVNNQTWNKQDIVLATDSLLRDATLTLDYSDRTDVSMKNGLKETSHSNAGFAESKYM
jgi:hypothetical protein